MRTGGRARLSLPRAVTAGPARPEAVDVPNRFGSDPYASVVGMATHRVIASLAAQRHVRHAELLDRSWSLAGAALSGLVGNDTRISRRNRAARLSVAGAAAVYLARFMPPSTWALLGSELTIGPGARVDLCWEGAGAILIDELKVADARTVGRGAGPAGRQTDRYVELARSAFGDRFVGLRLLYLGAASRSRFVFPDGRSVALSDTAVEFGEPRGVLA